MAKHSAIASRPVQTQFLIFTLFGDYVIYEGGTIWTSALLDLMGLLSVSERAVRSALSRMSRKGWVTSERHGRMSQYKLTRRGRTLLQRGAERIFEPTFVDWDNHWQIVVYSLPEKKRRKRHVLRKQLKWYGFGHLAPGTWCSPHDRRDELEELFADLQVEPYVDVFNGMYRGPVTDSELVERCWDLDALAAQYEHFIDAFADEYQECLARSNVNGQSPLTAEECFTRRFWLTHAFTSVPLEDPNLPTSLLPDDWIGLRARELFDNYHRLLGEQANEFVREVMNSVDP